MQSTVTLDRVPEQCTLLGKPTIAVHAFAVLHHKAIVPIVQILGGKRDLAFGTEYILHNGHIG